MVFSVTTISFGALACSVLYFTEKVCVSTFVSQAINKKKKRVEIITTRFFIIHFIIGSLHMILFYINLKNYILKNIVCKFTRYELLTIRRSALHFPGLYEMQQMAKEKRWRIF